MIAGIENIPDIKIYLQDILRRENKKQASGDYFKLGLFQTWLFQTKAAKPREIK